MGTRTIWIDDRLIKLIVCLIVFSVCAWSANAQTSQLCDNDALGQERMTASYHSHHDKRILLLAGSFDPDAASRVNPYVGRTGTYDEVWMCSNGGRVSQGKSLGRKLASVRATVRVPSGFQCVSSCTIAFLGGFVRIIEPEAKYIVHASSSFSSIDPNRKMIIDCRPTDAAPICDTLVNIFDDPSDRCRTEKELEDPTASCIIFDPTPNRKQKIVIMYRFKALIILPAIESTVEVVTDQMVESDVVYAANLIQYYQEMLLAGPSNYVLTQVYDNLKEDFKPLGIYDPGNYGQDARFLADDVRALNNADVIDRVAIWQSIFTDSELNVQRQMIDHIKKTGLSFGPASGDAVKIMDAMLICQIQTLCQLEKNEAAALGIHNVFDAE